MKIASFNINGIKARLPALLDWLRDAGADVVVLQEIKTTDDQFPRLEIEDMGYNVETHGQKGFNGVAILSKLPLEDVRRGLPGDDGDEQARWIEATSSAAPSGSAASTCRTATRRRGRSTTTSSPGWTGCRPAPPALLAAEETAVVLGDYNVIPEPKDCWDPRSGPGTRCSCPRPAPPSAGSRTSASPTRCAPSTRARASTPSGTTRPAPCRRTGASASTTCC